MYWCIMYWCIMCLCKMYWCIMYDWLIFNWILKHSLLKRIIKISEPRNSERVSSYTLSRQVCHAVSIPLNSITPSLSCWKHPTPLFTQDSCASKIVYPDPSGHSVIINRKNRKNQRIRGEPITPYLSCCKHPTPFSRKIRASKKYLFSSKKKKPKFVYSWCKKNQRIRGKK